jgi:predicted DNA-binding transcriptional regulator AlpA
MEPSMPRQRLHSPSATPSLSVEGGNRLLSRAEVIELIGVSGVTLWSWQRQGRFPRSRDLNGKAVWLASEVERFLANLPTTKLKGDADD